MKKLARRNTKADFQVKAAEFDYPVDLQEDYAEDTEDARYRNVAKTTDGEVHKSDWYDDFGEAYDAFGGFVQNIAREKDGFDQQTGRLKTPEIFEYRFTQSTQDDPGNTPEELQDGIVGHPDRPYGTKEEPEQTASKKIASITFDEFKEKLAEEEMFDPAIIANANSLNDVIAELGAAEGLSDEDILNFASQFVNVDWNLYDDIDEDGNYSEFLDITQKQFASKKTAEDQKQRVELNWVESGEKKRGVITDGGIDLGYVYVTFDDGTRIGLGKKAGVWYDVNDITDPIRISPLRASKKTGYFDELEDINEPSSADEDIKEHEENIEKGDQPTTTFNRIVDQPGPEAPDFLDLEKEEQYESGRQDRWEEND